MTIFALALKRLPSSVTQPHMSHFWAKFWGYRHDLVSSFDSNNPLALLINPLKFQVDDPKGNKNSPKKTEANLGPNRRNAKVACRRSRADFFSISWGSTDKIIKPLLSYLLKTNSPILMKKMYFAVRNTNGRGENIKSIGESKDLMSWKFTFYGKGHSPRDE